jgi:hypothetical protein
MPFWRPPQEQLGQPRYVRSNPWALVRRQRVRLNEIGRIEILITLRSQDHTSK